MSSAACHNYILKPTTGSRLIDVPAPSTARFLFAFSHLRFICCLKAFVRVRPLQEGETRDDNLQWNDNQILLSQSPSGAAVQSYTLGQVLEPGSTQDDMMNSALRQLSLRAFKPMKLPHAAPESTYHTSGRTFTAVPVGHHSLLTMALLLREDVQ